MAEKALSLAWFDAFPLKLGGENPQASPQGFPPIYPPMTILECQA